MVALLVSPVPQVSMEFCFERKIELAWSRSTAKRGLICVLHPRVVLVVENGVSVPLLHCM